MATRKFNDDDLADYDEEDWDSEWDEVAPPVEEKKKISQGPQKNLSQKSPITSAPVSGFTSNQLAKLRKFNEDLGSSFQVSTWFLEKFAKDGVVAAKAELAKPADVSPTVFVVIGHVDAGKSTLMAQLVGRYGTDATEARVQVGRQKSRNRSGSQNNMAWELDVGQDERDHGVTIDAKSKSLMINSKPFVAIDAPGHADYVPSMLLGAMQADAAVLVIDCVKFDSGFSRGGQTKEHVSLIRSLGIHQLVVVLNKIDAIESEARFGELESIKSQLGDFIIDEMRFTKIDFVPISAIQGQNIFEPLYPEDLDTPCLEAALSKLVPKPHGPTHHSVCIPVVDVNGDKLSGRVEAGTVHEKERLLLLPSKQLIQLSVGEARCPGSYLESIAFSFVDGSGGGASSPSSGGSLIHPGSVIVDPLLALEKIEAVESFFAKILVINDDFMPIVRGQSVTINVHTAMSDGSISRIVTKVGEGGSLGPAKCLVKGDVAIVEISLRKGSVIVVEPDCTSRVTGRVVIRDRGVTIAAGLVISHNV